MKVAGKALFLAVLAVLAVVVAVFLVVKTNDATIVLSGNTPAGVKAAQLVGHGDPERQVEVVVGLKLQNEQDLNDLLVRQANLTSPDFRKYLSPDEFAQRFSPTQDDYDQVVSYLRSCGLKISYTPANRLLIVVSGTLAQLERALGVTLNEYRFAGRTYISNDADPQIPANLQGLVQCVIGLDTFAQLQPLHRHVPKTHIRPQPHGAPYGLSPQQVATVYNFPNSNNAANGKKYTGAGRTIAIATAYNYSQADVEAYWKHFGISRSGKVSNVYVGGTSAQLNEETTLDLEQAGAQAPGADIVMYMGVDPKFTTFTQVFNTIVTDNKADVVSISWGLCELWTGSAQMKTESAIFKQGIAQGMVICAASGDNGAYDCADDEDDKNKDDGKKKPPVLSLDYPSSDPSVTGVGGTTLLIGEDSSRRLEIAWDGAGGGVSSEWSRPAWQTGPGVPPGDRRVTADVALVSDPWTGYAVYYQGSWDFSGGTSFAAPNWAALWALVDEAAGVRVGSANEAIYRIGRSSDYSTVFTDIIQGNNGNGRGSGYPSGVGWDHPTGWGVPNGEALVEWLQKDTGHQPVR